MTPSPWDAGRRRRGAVGGAVAVDREAVARGPVGGGPGVPMTGSPSELGGDQVEGRRAVLELLSVGRRTVRQILSGRRSGPLPSTGPD